MLTLGFVLSAILASAHAANDWSQPCTSGYCEYDWKDDANTMSSSMALSGTGQVLSDITPAAGWQIMGCNPEWSQGSHDIRMVCAGTPEQMENCEHVYQNGGAENTVVRLPESCGKGPFARVQGTYVPQDQSMPANMSKIMRRDSQGTAVRGLTLDYNFGAIPTSRGKLSLHAASSNMAAHSVAGRSVGSGVAQVTSAVGAVATAAVGAVKSGVQSVKSATTVNQTDNSASIPVKLADSFNLLDASIKCAAGQASGNANVKIDVSANLDGKVNFGYTFVGSVVPLELDDVKVIATMSGDATAVFKIDAQAEGKFDTGSLPLFKTGLPGLSVPGIFTVGPAFSVSTQLTMDIGAQATMSVTTDVAFPNVQMIFPQTSGKSVATVTPKAGTAPLKLSTQENGELTGSVVAHLIPRLDLGIDIGSGLAKATVFLDMDMSGELDMGLHAAANSTTSVGVSSSESASSSATSSTSTTSAKTSSTAPAKTSAVATAKASPPASAKAAPAAPAKALSAPNLLTPPKAAAPVAVKTSAKGTKARRAAVTTTGSSAGGCVTLTEKVDVEAGLQGTLKPLFNKETNFPIFSTKSQLFNKCFGDAVKPAKDAAAPAKTTAAKAKVTARAVSGGSTIARMYRERERRAAAAAGTTNEITPSPSKASTSGLSCPSKITPLSGLLSRI